MRETPDEMREMTPSATGASPVARLIATVTYPWGEATFLRVYSVAVAMALFLSFTGALGTTAFESGARIAFWLVLMLGGSMIMQVVNGLIDRFFPLDPLPEAIAMFALATPAITILVWAVGGQFTGDGFDLARLPRNIPPVLVITGVMSALHYALNRAPKQSHVFEKAPVADAPSPVPGAAFRDRLPFKYRQAGILALAAEDHYLRVYTAAGETLVLMRLYDAIRELDGIEGSQTHRSWWVAKDAVRDINRSDGKVGLVLTVDVTAPVSRSYGKSLKDAGWY